MSELRWAGKFRVIKRIVDGSVSYVAQENLGPNTYEAWSDLRSVSGCTEEVGLREMSVTCDAHFKRIPVEKVLAQ